MLSWIYLLSQSDLPDFWINVWAGVPFVLFDLLIITYLVPKVIKGYEDKNWEDTRLLLVNDLIISYGSDLFHPPVRPSLIASPNMRERESYISDALLRLREEAIESIRHREVELQTALPALGADMMGEMLRFHYTWRSILNGAVTVFDAAIAVAGENRLGNPNPHLSDRPVMFLGLLPGFENMLADATVDLWRLEQRFRRDGALVVETPLIGSLGNGANVVGLLRVLEQQVRQGGVDEAGAQKILSEARNAWEERIRTLIRSKPVQAYVRRHWWYRILKHDLDYATFKARKPVPPARAKAAPGWSGGVTMTIPSPPGRNSSTPPKNS